MTDPARSFPRKPVFTKGTVYVPLRITIGPLSFRIDVAPYLRAKTIRRLNRQRSKGERLTFRSKIQISPDMLEALAPFIPSGTKLLYYVIVGTQRHPSLSGAAHKIGMSFAA